jgi:hypothetical protein
MYEYEKPYGNHTSKESIYHEMWRRMLVQEEWRGEGILLPGASRVVTGGVERWVSPHEPTSRFEFRVGFVFQSDSKEYLPGVMFYHTPKTDTVELPSEWREVDNP